MPIYEYRCTNCGASTDSTSRNITHPSNCCQAPLRRKFSVNVASTFKPHFNNAVGQYVRNEQEFRDALKRGSEQQSERTGMEHNYTPIDPRDMKPAGDGSGAEESAKAWHDKLKGASNALS